VQVRDLLEVPELGLRLLTDRRGLERSIRHVYTTDLPDPSRYVTRGDLVLTGLLWCRGPADADLFVGALARCGAVALGAGEAIGAVPGYIVEACGKRGVALLAVPAETSFGAVTDEVSRRLAGDMARVLGRRRLLLSAVAQGAGLEPMLRVVGRETGLRCWLLSATGRLVTGTGEPLPRPVALRLAAEYLAAARLPAVSGGRHSLFGVGGEPRITSWFLACDGQERDWSPELRETVSELAADVAIERARLAAALSGERKLAEAVITRLVADGAEQAETASLMRAAELAPDGPYLAVAIRADAGSAGPGAWDRAGTSPSGWDGWGRDLAEELIVPYAGRAAVAPSGETIFGLVAAGRDNAAEALAGWLREADAVFQAAGVRLTVGLSGPAAGVAGLAGALREAASALRIAAVRPATVSVATSDEVDSHELLLASVPSTVLRSFRDRLLGPLADYDERHHAELLPTLRSFLACDGSWNSCAARLYVHVNTVRYRIGRIEELTGRDLSSLADRVDFFLALRCQ